jgi:hypothetical protein
MNQLHFDFYATREECVSAFVQQLLHLAPKFRIKGRAK